MHSVVFSKTGFCGELQDPYRLRFEEPHSLPRRKLPAEFTLVPICFLLPVDAANKVPRWVVQGIIGELSRRHRVSVAG